MDIAEIRKKARLLDVREEVPLNEASLPEEISVASEKELQQDAKTQTATISVPEVEVQSQEGFIDLDDDIRAGEQILESWEKGLDNAAREVLTPVVPDIPKPELFVDEDADEEEKEEVDEEEVEAIIFSMENENYGIDIHQVKEVIKFRALTEVPKAPRDIIGVMSLRGVVIPVMNLRGRLCMPTKNIGERIIIVRDGAGLLGLLVDTVRHVVRVPEKSIEPAPSINTIDVELIRGIGRYKGGMFILLDTQKMLESK